MSERIELLAVQAAILASAEVTWHLNQKAWHELYSKKFAELIVKECLAVNEDVANADGTGPWFDGYVSGVAEVNRKIKQHFGVKE